MRVLDAAQMRQVDEMAIERLGVSSLVLMENAALGVADAIGERFPTARSPLVVCGPGSNGGDGFAVARQLLTRGYRPRIVCVGPARGDAAIQREITRRAGIEAREIPIDDAGEGASQAEAVIAAAADGADLLVDALFGTGLSRPLQGVFAVVAEAMDRLPLALPRVAVDLPSGLDASHAAIAGASVRADLTVAFAALKVAHVLAPACDRCGELVVADLGVPEWLLDEVPGPPLTWLTRQDMAGYCAPRPLGTHKGQAGHLLLVGGSPRLRGAIVLAARGALRSGVGLVTVATPAVAAAALAAQLPEAMSRELPWTDAAGLGAGALEILREVATKKGAVVAGPGMGRWAGSRAAIEALVLDCAAPVLVDADAIQIWAGRPGDLRRRTAPTVLTPHPGELAGLYEVPVEAIEADRLGWVRRAAAETGAIVVLKGRRTLIAAPDGETSINSTGGPALATGGTGDVLAGVIGSLLAQGFEALAAAQLGCFVHGAAGDRWSARQGDRGLLASDLADEIPSVLRDLAQPEDDPAGARAGAGAGADAP